MKTFIHQCLVFILLSLLVPITYSLPLKVSSSNGSFEQKAFFENKLALNDSKKVLSGSTPQDGAKNNELHQQGSKDKASQKNKFILVKFIGFLALTIGSPILIGLLLELFRKLLQRIYPLHRKEEGIFYQVGIPKLITMTIFTFGFYLFYWGYKNWQFLNQVSQKKVLPILRSIFLCFSCFSLYERINQHAETLGEEPSLDAGWLGILFFFWLIILPQIITNISQLFHFGDTLWPDLAELLIVMLIFIPILPVQREVNRLNAKYAAESPCNNRLSVMNIIWIVVSTSVVIFGIFGELI